MPISLLIFIHFLRRFRSRGLQPQHAFKRLTQSLWLCIWVASSSSYLCGAGLKMVPLIGTKLKFR